MDPTKRFLPARHRSSTAKLSVIQPDADKIMEYVEHSWYTADSGNLNPRDGRDRTRRSRATTRTTSTRG